MKYNVLILGASYGSLFSTKLLMAGHGVSLVCTRPTAELINREGTVVRFPIRGRQSPVDISSKKLPGALRATTPDEVDPREFQLIVLGMQEAQYGTSGVRELMRWVAESRIPCLAIMNMPCLEEFRSGIDYPLQPRSTGISPARSPEECFARWITHELQGSPLRR